MNLLLQGKRALVTGSTAGIGFAIASALLQEGANVVINGRTEQGVQSAIKRLEGDGKVSGIAADVATVEGVNALVRQLPEVDILINNMGIFDPKPFEEIADSEWIRFFETNVMSGVRLSRAYIGAMKQRNWGRIIFISSESGICPPAEMVHYGMTKSAQLSVSRGLAETCVGTAVTVNSVLPGPTLTEGAKAFFETLAAQQGIGFDEATKKFFAEARPTSLIQRFAKPEEVASMVTYLCSPLAAATTGAALRVDGGVVRSLV
jgi:NAD(P)-dependent dehydrogenase (short-subunit alcohol dehydrogenase family)